MPQDAKTPAHPPAAGAPEAKRRGSKFKLILAIVVAVVTAIECGAGVMYLRKANGSVPQEEPLEAEPTSDASDAVPAAAAHDPHKPASGKKKAAKSRPPEESEIDLGGFRVTAFQPLSNTTVRVDFHLFGTVAHGHEEAFTALFEAKKQRFRDQVIATVRSAEMADFTEPGLGLIKRRILETTNRTIGKPCLDAVLFSEFSFIEQ